MAELLSYSLYANRFEARNKPPERVSYGQEGRFIEEKRQQMALDCGQTCLEMLGYEDARKQFADQPLWADQVAAMVARKDDIRFPEETIDFSKPHLVLLKKARESFVGPDLGHWVIRVNDTIICPTWGVQPAKEYLRDRSF